MLVAAGGTVAGYALYVKGGKPCYEYNWFSQQRSRVCAPTALGAGAHTVRVEFKYDGGGAGKGGVATLFVDDRKAGEARVERTVPARFSADETFDVGEDTGTSASSEYSSPFAFTGTIKKVEIELRPQDAKTAQAESRASRDTAVALAAAH